jgi:2,3-diaminopropionate biosynthesis protein SbnA
MGIGLAQACAYFGLSFICVVDPKATAQNVAILKAYGAMVDLVSEPDPLTGEFLQARINRVRELLRSVPNGWWADQYANRFNAAAYHGMMDEIVRQLHGPPDLIICATGTCGTLRGCADYIRAHGLQTEVWAVDAEGSVIFGQKPKPRLIPGHGASRVPELYAPGLANRCIHVSDLDCVMACRRLMRREAIFSGGSSGAVIAGIGRVMPEIPDGAICVAILADRGERYVDTIYCDQWVKEHFGKEPADLDFLSDGNGLNYTCLR